MSTFQKNCMERFFSSLMLWTVAFNYSLKFDVSLCNHYIKLPNYLPKYILTYPNLYLCRLLLIIFSWVRWQVRFHEVHVKVKFWLSQNGYSRKWNKSFLSLSLHMSTSSVMCSLMYQEKWQFQETNKKWLLTWVVTFSELRLCCY